MRPLVLASALLVFAFAQDANAQGDPFDEPAEKPKDAADPNKPADGQPAEPVEESDPSLFEGENPGEDENPEDAKIDLVGKPKVKKKAAKIRPPGYPQEVLYRPLTLPGGMAQGTFEYDFRIAPLGNGIIGVAYGINSQIQVGLRYGIGSFHDIEGIDGSYEVGKTLAIDAEYTIKKWIAAQLSLPMLVDPYTLGVTLGVPMKFTFRDRLRFDLGRDLITFRTHREFYPRIGNAVATKAIVLAEDSNTIQDKGEIRLAGTITYQHSTKLAGELRMGLTLPDFGLNSDSPFQFEVGGTYAHSQSIDFGGTIGFLDLGTAGDSFGVSLFTRFRIGG